MKESMSRRSFLLGASVLGVGAAAGIAGCASGTQEDPSPEAADGAPVADEPECTVVKYTWEVKPEEPTEFIDEIDCDIVVVGGGIAGCCGALAAADKGAVVHCLEKSNEVGLSREMSLAFNCDIMKQAGVILPREVRDAMLSMYFPYGTTQTSGACVIQDNGWQTTQFIDTSGPWMDWFAPILVEEGIDVHYANLPGEYEGIPMAISYGKAGNPPDDWQSAVWRAAEKRGAIFDFETAGYMLTQNEAGDVTGIIAKTPDGYVKYNTSMGVLLASGGISRDEDMMKALFWGNDRISKHFAYPSHTGDAHKMAIWAGGTIDEVFWGDPFICTTFVDQRPSRVGSQTDYEGFDDTWPSGPGVGQLGVLWLDMAGRRFTNEQGDLVGTIQAILNQEQGQAFALWDSAWESKVGHLIPKGDVPAWSKFVTWFAMNTQEQIDQDVIDGITVKCDTLEEVAQVTGMDYETMMENIERYNAYCAEGYDWDFSKDPNWMAPIDTPPYYVSGIGMAECVTRGGVHVDRHLRAINKETGRTIKGLWAAGTVASGCFGFGRMFGSVPIGQNAAWRAVYDMMGEELPKTDWMTLADIAAVDPAAAEAIGAQLAAMAAGF
ncbi:MAG: FAD-binding protein [Eggerthellaceae bacterium]|nr:FAD-binding protein [Eggerthellaceae bacterium]